MQKATVRDSGAFRFLELDGASVTIFRNEFNGQLCVSINTEDAEPDDHDDAGLPFISVDINGGEVYDHEDPGGSGEAPLTHGERLDRARNG